MSYFLRACLQQRDMAWCAARSVAGFDQWRDRGSIYMCGIHRGRRCGSRLLSWHTASGEGGGRVR